MVRKAKEINEQWQKFANQLGADFKPSSFLHYPKIEGIYENHQFRLWVAPGSQYSPPTTNLKINLLNSKRLLFIISTKSFFTRISERFGGQDLKIGNPEFDELFRIKGNVREQDAWVLIDSSIQRQILSLKEPIKFNVRIKKGFATYWERGISKDFEGLKEIFDVLLNITKKAEERYHNY
ncbi:MAG TPA: hypothetical protein HA348_01735 [Thermoplasmata archaeon]|nr:hypothetical protein [Thermoplasmata archaeon]